MMPLADLIYLFLFLALLFVLALFLGIPKAIYSLLPRARQGAVNGFPSAITLALGQSEAMKMVHDLLLQEDFGGCDWQITDEDVVNSCIRAVLAGTPPGAGQRIVEILIYVFFGNLGPAQTRVEWSFIVNCGTDQDVNLILRKTNLVFENAFLQQEKRTSALVVEASKIESPGPTQAEAPTIAITSPMPNPVPTPMSAPQSVTADSVKNCHICNYHLDVAFSFCLHCGAAN